MSNKTEIKATDYSTGRPVVISVANGLINDISFIENEGVAQDLFVAPGLFDNQVNGFKGVDFSDLNLTAYDMHRAVNDLCAEGVTSFFPTVLTNSHENLIKIFRNLAAALNDPEVSYSVPGFHLEGPYISPEEGFYGCHPSGFIRLPSWDEFLSYQEAAEGNIRQITISPESEGCMTFIRKCAENNVAVAIGHSNASSVQIKEAVDNGARLSTHLGNGCANMIHRHRNPLWPQLANDQLIPTIIADGHHLLPEELKVFYRVKGPAKMILTSDVTHLSGMKPGNYMFFGARIVMTEDGLIKNPVLDCLAGASLPLRTGIGNIMKFTGCSLDNAINMASSNVADIYGLKDRGRMISGMRADLILFTVDNFNIILKQVWIKGRRII